MDQLVCTGCGYSQYGYYRKEAKLHCSSCFSIMTVRKDVPYPPSKIASGKPESTILKRGELKPFSFQGSAAAYFRIWIVNLLLTLLTAGIYAAWAKVRNRRYLYAHTHLDNTGFDYTARPTALLKGNLIIAVGLAGYYFSQAWHPLAHVILIILAGLVLPFLIVQSLVFSARNTRYRNVAFGFRGGLADSYLVYLLAPAMIPATFGIAYPYWAYLRKKYFFDNLAYGAARMHFEGRAGHFFIHYIFGGAMFGVLMAATVFMMPGLAALMGPVNSNASTGSALSWLPLLHNSVLLIGIIGISQLVYAGILNHCLENSRLGQMRFESHINPLTLAVIQVTNLLVVVCSCGLLIPWARIRRARYIFSNLVLLAPEGLDGIETVIDPQVGALGDVATDYFGIEIGF